MYTILLMRISARGQRPVPAPRRRLDRAPSDRCLCLWCSEAGAGAAAAAWIVPPLTAVCVWGAQKPVPAPRRTEGATGTAAGRSQPLTDAEVYTQLRNICGPAALEDRLQIVQMLGSG